jgi:hypothetical protein
MGFIWFNLMPRPYLPDDFRERHRSVWVDIPRSMTRCVGTRSTTLISTSSNLPKRLAMTGFRRHAAAGGPGLPQLHPASSGGVPSRSAAVPSTRSAASAMVSNFSSAWAGAV